MVKDIPCKKESKDSKGDYINITQDRDCKSKTVKG